MYVCVVVVVVVVIVVVVQRHTDVQTVQTILRCRQRQLGTCHTDDFRVITYDLYFKKNTVVL